MTLRILDDSLRLRLSPDEVRQLDATGVVEATMHVAPGAALCYAIRAADVDGLAAELDGATLAVLVPRDWTEDWALGDVVGFEGAQDAGDGRTLALLVERDLGCGHDLSTSTRDASVE